MINTVNINNPKYKWEVLALLWLAFLLNQADRQIFNVVLPLIRAELRLSDLQVGMIATGFNLVYALMVPLAGYAGDRYSRKWIIVCSLIFWSFATVFTGFGTGLLTLILLRSIATGGGEAFFGPSNYALLAQYHKSTRSLAMAIHQTSYYIGIIISGLAAAYIGERWGWRYAFFVFGSAGILLGLLMIARLKDKTEPIAAKGNQVKFWSGFNLVFRTPTALMLTIAFSGLIFGLTGYLTWMPTYLYENFGMSLTKAGFNAMFYTHSFAFTGILIAGALSDKFAKKNKGIRLIMQAAGLIVAAPFLLLLGNSTNLMLVYAGLAGFGFARAFFDANTYTVLYDVIPAQYHAAASGVMIMTGFGIGSLSSVLLGYLKPLMGLSFGFTVLAGVWVLSGICLLIAYKYTFQKDYKNARLAEL